MKKNHNFAIYSNGQASMLNRISAVFSRVNLSIESLSVCETEQAGVFRYSIQVNCDQQIAARLSKQLERQIEIFKADFQTEDNMIHQEVALYKIAAKSMLEQTLTEQIIHRHHARVLSMNSEYIVIEKTGSRTESQALLDDLSPVGVLEFVRSGPVSIGKPMTAVIMAFNNQSNGVAEDSHAVEIQNI